MRCMTYPQFADLPWAWARDPSNFYHGRIQMGRPVFGLFQFVGPLVLVVLEAITLALLKGSVYSQVI